MLSSVNWPSVAERLLLFVAFQTVSAQCLTGKNAISTEQIRVDSYKLAHIQNTCVRHRCCVIFNRSICSVLFMWIRIAQEKAPPVSLGGDMEPVREST